MSPDFNLIFGTFSFPKQTVVLPDSIVSEKKATIKMSSSEFEKKSYIAHNHGKVHVSSVKMI